MAVVVIEELGPIILRGLLVPLLEILGFVVALGLIYLVDAFVRALFGTTAGAIAKIPWIGKKATGPIHTVEQKIVNGLGRAAGPLDRRIGIAFHTLADAAEQLGKGLLEAAFLSAYMVWYMTGKYPLSAMWHKIDWLVHHLRVVKVVTHEVTKEIPAVQKAIAHPNVGKLGAGIKAVTRPLEAEIARLRGWVVPRLHVLQHAIGVAIPHDIAGLRARTHAIEQAYHRLAAQIKAREKGIATTAIVGAIALSLGKLGLGWTRCTNWRRIGRAGCGLDQSLLDALLIDALLLTSSISIVALAEELEPITRLTARATREFVVEAGHFWPQ